MVEADTMALDGGNGWERWRGETSARLRSIEDQTSAIFERIDGLAEWKTTVEARLAKVALVFGVLGGMAALVAELALKAFAAKGGTP